MTSLLDIGDLRSKVDIRGKEIEVQGISAETFFHLLDDIPELRRMLSGGVAGGPEVKPQDLLTKVPGAVSSIIVASTDPGYYKLKVADRQKLLDVAARLNMGEQAELIRKIWDLTFPKGVQSFLDALAEVMKAAEGSGWVPGTPSPERLNNSEQQASDLKSGE